MARHRINDMFRSEGADGSLAPRAKGDQHRIMALDGTRDRARVENVSGLAREIRVVQFQPKGLRANAVT